jgi:hypothetical protein
MVPFSAKNHQGLHTSVFPKSRIARCGGMLCLIELHLLYNPVCSKFPTFWFPSNITTFLSTSVILSIFLDNVEMLIYIFNQWLLTITMIFSAFIKLSKYIISAKNVCLLLVLSLILTWHLFWRNTCFRLKQGKHALIYTLWERN